MYVICEVAAASTVHNNVDSHEQVQDIAACDWVLDSKAPFQSAVSPSQLTLLVRSTDEHGI